MDFGAMFQTWINVLIHPSEATFEEERHKPHANLGTAIIAIIAAAFLAAIFRAVAVAISNLLGIGSSLDTIINQLPPEVAYSYAQYMTGAGQSIIVAMFISFCTYLIFAPIGFLIGSLIWFVFAKLFGGQGEFEEQTYLLSTLYGAFNGCNRRN